MDYRGMELDAAELAPEDAARRILEHVERVRERRKEDEAALMLD
jgi:hypothetical protein